MNRFDDAPDSVDSYTSSVTSNKIMMPDATASSSLSSSLLARARENDPHAWARLCQVAAPLVYGWCRRASLQDSDARDVGQEVFSVVASRLAAFRRDVPGGSFRGWLWGITNNKLKEHFRQQADLPGGDVSGAARQHLQELDESFSSGFSDAGAHARKAALIRRVLDLLRTDFDPQTLQAFWRCAVDGQAPCSVAAELNLTPGAVRQAKFRVTKRLREELAELL